MTGAPIPAGADAVVMVEHTTRARRPRAHRPPRRAAAVHQSARLRGGGAARWCSRAGKRLDYSRCRAAGGVRARPRCGLPATHGGDRRHRRRDRGSGRDAGGIPDSQFQRVLAGGAGGARRRQFREMLPVARDTVEHTRAVVARGLEADLLLLSGGVSAGKYDVVEQVLADLGAEFYFDRVLIQPGQPLVFGRAREKFFFGLPGNPASTMVTFEIFARAALELLGGQEETALHMPFARLTRDFRHRAGLTRFLPARLSADGGEVTPVEWHGSGDIPALDARQRVPGGRSRSRRIRARRTRSGCCSNEETLALRFRRQPAHGGRFGQGRDAPHGARPRVRAHRARGARRSCRENPKGNPLEIARIAGIAAAKRTSDLIPLCHPLMLTHADVEVTLEAGRRAHRRPAPPPPRRRAWRWRRSRPPRWPR